MCLIVVWHCSNQLSVSHLDLHLQAGAQGPPQSPGYLSDISYQGLKYEEVTMGQNKARGMKEGRGPAWGSRESQSSKRHNASAPGRYCAGMHRAAPA